MLFLVALLIWILPSVFAAPPDQQQQLLILHDLPSGPHVSDQDRVQIVPTTTSTLRRQVKARLRAQYPDVPRSTIRYQVRKSPGVVRKLGTLVRYQPQAPGSKPSNPTEASGQNEEAPPARQNSDELWRWLQLKRGYRQEMARLGFHDEHFIHDHAVRAFGPRETWDSVYARHVTRQRILERDKLLRRSEPRIPESELQEMVESVIQSHLALGPFPTRQQFEERRQKVAEAKLAYQAALVQGRSPETVIAAIRRYERLAAGQALDYDFPHEIKNHERRRRYERFFKGYTRIRKTAMSEDEGRMAESRYQKQYNKMFPAAASDYTGLEVINALEIAFGNFRVRKHPRRMIRRVFGNHDENDKDELWHRTLWDRMHELVPVQTRQVYAEREWAHRYRRNWNWQYIRRVLDGLDREFYYTRDEPPPIRRRYMQIVMSESHSWIREPDRHWLVDHFERAYSQDKAVEQEQNA